MHTPLQPQLTLMEAPEGSLAEQQQDEEPMGPHLSRLPAPVLLRVLKLLEMAALLSLAQCCEALRTHCEDPSLWSGRCADGAGLRARAAALLARQLRLPAQALVHCVDVVRAAPPARHAPLRLSRTPVRAAPPRKH